MTTSSEGPASGTRSASKRKRDETATSSHAPATTNKGKKTADKKKKKTDSSPSSSPEQPRKKKGKTANGPAAPPADHETSPGQDDSTPPPVPTQGPVQPSHDTDPPPPQSVASSTTQEPRVAAQLPSQPVASTAEQVQQGASPPDDRRLGLRPDGQTAVVPGPVGAQREKHDNQMSKFYREEVDRDLARKLQEDEWSGPPPHSLPQNGMSTFPAPSTQQPGTTQGNVPPPSTQAAPGQTVHTPALSLRGQHDGMPPLARPTTRPSLSESQTALGPSRYPTTPQSGQLQVQYPSAIYVATQNPPRIYAPGYQPHPGSLPRPRKGKAPYGQQQSLPSALTPVGQEPKRKRSSVAFVGDDEILPFNPQLPPSYLNNIQPYDPTGQNHVVRWDVPPESFIPPAGIIPGYQQPQFGLFQRPDLWYTGDASIAAAWSWYNEVFGRSLQGVPCPLPNAHTPLPTSAEIRIQERNAQEQADRLRYPGGRAGSSSDRPMEIPDDGENGDEENDDGENDDLETEGDENDDSESNAADLANNNASPAPTRDASNIPGSSLPSNQQASIHAIRPGNAPRGPVIGNTDEDLRILGMTARSLRDSQEIAHRRQEQGHVALHTNTLGALNFASEALAQTERALRTHYENARGVVKPATREETFNIFAGIGEVLDRPEEGEEEKRKLREQDEKKKREEEKRKLSEEDGKKKKREEAAALKRKRAEEDKEKQKKKPRQQQQPPPPPPPPGWLSEDDEDEDDDAYEEVWQNGVKSAGKKKAYRKPEGGARQSKR